MRIAKCCHVTATYDHDPWGDTTCGLNRNVVALSFKVVGRASSLVGGEIDIPQLCDVFFSNKKKKKTVERKENTIENIFVCVGALP